MTVRDVFRQMDRTEAIGLLHDGAGWDALRISKELDMAASQVRLGVARARLRAALSECSPCPDQLDGLMTFSADAVDHSMTCGECKETRRSLRAGKLALRDRWRAEAASHRTVSDKPAGGPGRLDRHKPRPRRAAVNITTTAHPRTDKAGRNPAGGHTSDDVLMPAWRREQQQPQPSPDDPSPRWKPPVTRPPDADAAPVRNGDGPAEPAVAGDVATARPPAQEELFPDLDIPDREPVRAPQDLTPVGPRPAGPLVSLPDRTPDKRLLSPTPAARPAQTVARQTPRRRGRGRTKRAGEAVLATLAALAGRVGGRHVVATIGALLTVTAGVVMLDSAGSDVTSGDGLATTAIVDQPAPAETTLRAGLAAGAAAGTPADLAQPEPTGIVATPEPPPLNPTDPTLATWQALSMCEASGNWGMNSGNGFYGGLQFTVESWELVGGTGLPHEAPALEQIRRAERLLDLQGWVAWPVCSVRLGLRTPEPGEVLHPAAIPQVDPAAPPLPGAVPPVEP